MPQEIFDECEEKGWPLLDSDGVPLGLNTVSKSQHWYGNPRDVRMKQLKQESESTEASDYFHRKLQNEQSKKSQIRPNLTNSQNKTLR